MDKLWSQGDGAVPWKASKHSPAPEKPSLGCSPEAEEW